MRRVTQNRREYNTQRQDWERAPPPKKWKNEVSMGSTLEDTFLWLLKGDLKAETESEIVAAQTRHHKKSIMQQKY